MLQYSTENSQIDRILQGITDVLETVFPKRIRACYLRGSYAHGTAVSTSDIDVIFIFKKDFISFDEEEKARRLCNQLSSIGGARLDAIVRSESQILSGCDTGIPKSQIAVQISIRSASKLLVGEDIREKIPIPSMDAYIRKCMHDVYYAYSLVRPQDKCLDDVIACPQTDSEFYGYELRQERTLNGVDVNSTRSLVQNVMCTAKAIVALKANKYVYRKRDCVHLYKQYINDEWVDLIKEVNEKCINQWSYLIPQGREDRTYLKSICRRALDFENYFLLIYKEYLLSEMTNSNRQIQCFTAKRLQQIGV